MNREQLVATERWLLAEELGVKVQHRVRNKLGSVRNAAFFIRRSLEKSAAPVPPRLLTFFQLIDDELCAADQSLGQARQRGAASIATPTRILLRDCIDSALSLRPPPPQVTVTVHCAAKLALTGCGAELSVALLCLLDNACEAAAPTGQVAIAAAAAQDHITVTVSDSGSGFCPEAAAQALTPFFTTKPGHLGMGLNIVERVVKAHGGQVHIEPGTRSDKSSMRKEGLGGAQVTLLLPHVLALAASSPADAEAT